MDQHIVLPAHNLIFSVTSVIVVVHDFGMVPIGWQYVYCDLYASVLHLKARIQERIGIPIALQQWVTYQGQEIFDNDILINFNLMGPHSVFNLTTADDWIPNVHHHILLPLPPPPDPHPQNANPQQAESQSHTYGSTGSNNSINNPNNEVAGGGSGMPEDALEFFMHFIDQVERANAGSPQLDPSKSFKFGIEERLLCPSGKVSYNNRVDYILPLNIPLHDATNKEQLEAFYKLKSERSLEGKEVLNDEIVRPTVPLEACLEIFSAPEEVHGFRSSALNAQTTAIKTAGLTSFPDDLVLHMRKFVMGKDWVPKKLDVYIDVPDVIDISQMRRKGLQPGEELLPKQVAGSETVESSPSADDNIVSQLVAMGFNNLHCKKAAINTSNSGVEEGQEAMDWLLSHMDDTDIDDPIWESVPLAVDQSQVNSLVSFGFQEVIAITALKASGGNAEKATDWIFSNPDASALSDMDATSRSAECSADGGLPDGGGKYKPMSHIGTSTHRGHYVA